jgi:hypothetical protein
LCHIAFSFEESTGELLSLVVAKFLYRRARSPNSPDCNRLRKFLQSSSRYELHHLQVGYERLPRTYARTDQEYCTVYRAFFSSKQQLDFEEGAAFVVEKYCPRLLTLYRTMPENEKKWIRGYDWLCAPYLEPATHQKEVIDWCSNQSVHKREHSPQ